MGDEVVDSSVVVGQKRQSNENGSGPPSKKVDCFFIKSFKNF